MMLSIATALVAALSTSVTAQSYSVATSHSSAPTVDLGYVKYAGIQNATAGINYYRGIPFAQPPIGELRWQKPRPIELSNNFTGKTINATKIAPWCWQSYPYSLADKRAATVEAAFLNQPQSEDCLVLDVLVPRKPKTSSLPVLVQIHGGGYVSGSAQSYPGDGLVNGSNGQIIYVSLQYRLGMFGFLAGAEVMANGVANAGLLDQRLALDWIQRNIRAFGGDPNRVTIWGGSAGGGSVSLQLTAAGAYDTPPFQAAIAEYPWWQSMLNASQQEVQYQATLQAANCTTLRCLRDVPESKLWVVNQAMQNISYLEGAPGTGVGAFWTGPVVDGKFVQMLPDQSFKQGNFYRVPLMMDRDIYEGVNYSNKSITTVDEETMDAQRLFPSASNSFFHRLYQLYPSKNYNSTFWQRVDWFSDWVVCCPTAYMGQAMTDSSYFNTSAVFKFTMAAGSELHAATQVFLTSNTTSFTANNQTLGEILRSYWISFTIAHDPNPYRIGNAPFWPSYRAAGSSYNDSLQVLAVTYNSITPQPDPDVGEKCDFFSSRGYVVQN